MKQKIAAILFSILSAIAIIFGLMYCLRGHLMDYHIAYLGKTESELNAFSDRIVPLYLALMKIAGACMIAIGLSSLPIIFKPLKREESWAWLVLLVHFTASLVFMFLVTHYIAGHIQKGDPRPPYILVLIMLGLLVIALALSFPKSFRNYFISLFKRKTN